MSIIFAVLLFSLLIFVHELGHFLAAKFFHVQVNEFAIFMGPAVWKKQVGDTLYSLRCIPVGGFCAMEGEDGDSENPHAFSKADWWKRLIILAAGAAMNFLAGLILLAVFYGGDQQFIMPQISYIEPGCTIAGENGIQLGDRLLEVDGEKIYVYSDFQMLIDLLGGITHDILVERSGERVLLENVAMEKREFVNEDGTTGLRYGFSFTLVDATLGNKVQYVWNNALDTVRLVRLSLQMLFTGKAGIRDVGGPVMIVQQMSEVADASPTVGYAILNLLYFGAFIAINLAVMNLLPIPALDGGRIFGLLITVLIERITRKKLDSKYEAYVHGAGMILLLALMAVIMFKDIFVWIRG